MNKKRPRLAVFRSHRYIYGQIIDDQKKITLFAARGKEPKEVGQSLAKKALKAGVKKVWFDRRKYKYHGRVKALAQAARKEGLVI